MKFSALVPQGKPAGASRNVGCFLRLSLFLILLASQKGLKESKSTVLFASNQLYPSHRFC